MCTQSKGFCSLTSAASIRLLLGAGFVKNGLALASTIPLLAWGMIQYSTGYEKAGQTQHGLDTLRWGTDYMLASYLGSGTNGSAFVAQVSFYSPVTICRFPVCSPGLQCLQVSAGTSFQSQVGRENAGGVSLLDRQRQTLLSDCRSAAISWTHSRGNGLSR